MAARHIEAAHPRSSTRLQITSRQSPKFYGADLDLCRVFSGAIVAGLQESREKDLAIWQTLTNNVCYE